MRTSADIAVVSVASDLDTETVSQVRDSIDAVIGRGCRRVVLNMDGARRIDRAGIGMVIAATQALRERDGLLSLINVHERAYRTLRTVRIVDIIPVSKAGPRPRIPDLPPSTLPLWRRAFTVDVTRMDETRHHVAELVGRMPLSDDSAFDLILAIGEAVGNAVDHAGGTIVVTVAAYADRAVVEVTDSGCGFELADEEDPEADQTGERGRGIALMRMLADSVVICRRPSGRGTCTRIVKLTQG